MTSRNSRQHDLTIASDGITNNRNYEDLSKPYVEKINPDLTLIRNDTTTPEDDLP